MTFTVLILKFGKCQMSTALVNVLPFLIEKYSGPDKLRLSVVKEYKLSYVTSYFGALRIK